jgi:hypothetical protein
MISSETVLRVFSKNSTDELRISEVVIGGRRYISVAIFEKEGGKFRRGITVSPSLAIEILPAIEKAARGAMEADQAAHENQK